MKIIECVPNFSEGRRPDVILKIQDSITSVQAIRLLDRHSDGDHNRTVFTFLGDPEAVQEAAFRAVQTASQCINMDDHRGCHPRIGAADVVPFIPLGETSMDECITLSRIFGKKIGDILQIPVYLYGESAEIPDRKNLETIRKGGYEKLKTDIINNPKKAPDFGPSWLGTAGAAAVGARKLLVAYNVFLDSSDLSAASKIARTIRQSNGGLTAVKAMGVLVDGLAQVSMNLIDFQVTNIEMVFEAISEEARKLGINVHHSELVGMIPEEALHNSYAHLIKLDNLTSSQVLSSPENYFSAQERLLDDFSSPHPSPAGLCAAAFSSAMAAGLLIKILKITQKKSSMIDSTRTLREIEIYRQAFLDIFTADQNVVSSVFALSNDKKESQILVSSGSFIRSQIDLMDQNLGLLQIIQKLRPVVADNLVPDLKTAEYFIIASAKSAAVIARHNLQFTTQKEIQDKLFSEIAQREKWSILLNNDKSCLFRMLNTSNFIKINSAKHPFHPFRSIFLFCFLVMSLFTQASLPARNQSDNSTNFSAISINSSPSTQKDSFSNQKSTENPTSVFLADYFPDAFRGKIHLPVGYTLTKSAEKQNNFSIKVGSEKIISTWIYTLVAPFPTIPDDVPSDLFSNFWKGKTNPDFPATELVMSSSTFKVMQDYLGSVQSKQIHLMDTKGIIDYCWNHSGSWAIIPFEEVEPRWKVISIGGISPLRKEFKPDQYLLTIPFSLISTDSQSTNDNQTEELIKSFPASNRLAEHLTTVILTGVTAIVRGVTGMMENRNMEYPASEIGDTLREADILHISNEIPFSPTCPPYYTLPDNLVFCTQPKYIRLLEYIGTDIVDLSGDHFRDWGPEATLYTINLYEKEGWKYFGGGKNLEDGRKALLIENNGNKLAFIGCNAKAPGYAIASKDFPGAVHCDFDFLGSEIQRVRALGYLPIVTYQHLEYYSYKAHPILEKDFLFAAKNGAVIVSGNQAHQPHAFSFYNNSLLHFGLGNLFFDQYKEGFPQRQAFIDRHIFYENKFIGTELLTTMFVDIGKSRFMTAQERADLLNTVFSASKWQLN